MSEEKKIQKLFSKLNVDGADLYQLSSVLKTMYDTEDDYTEILNDIIKIKDDIIKVVNSLKKEL